MKKISYKQRNRNVVFNSRAKACEIRMSHLRRAGKLYNQHKPTSARRVTVRAPEEFNLNGEVNRDNLKEFIDKIEDALLSTSSLVFINFDKTNKLMPCGTLLFRARIDLLIEQFPNRMSCSYPIDDVVGQLFQYIGLLEKLGLSPKYEITADNVKCWHSVEGYEADGSKFAELLLSYANDLNQPMRMGLFDSMTEAITNTSHHAYDGMKKAPPLKKWWLFATKDKTNEIITVAVYDAGMGIAGSLRVKPDLADIIRRVVRDTKGADLRLVLAAIGSNRSKTELPYRGKGLPDMLKFVKSTNIGGLLIHSNKATFMYSASTDSEQTKTYRYEFPGTLIQWTLPLTDEV